MLRAFTAILLSRAARTQNVVDAQQATMLHTAKTRRNMAYGFFTGLFASLKLISVTDYSNMFAPDERLSSIVSAAACNLLSLLITARLAASEVERALEPV